MSGEKYLIKQVSFKHVLPIWSQELWPNRNSKIRAVDPRDQDGKFQPFLLKESPVFLALFDKQNLIGTNSFYPTSLTQCRSRGLWMNPDYRNRGLGELLLRETVKLVSEKNFREIWALPRQKALKVYEKIGFYRKSKFFDKEMEFGPNCLAIKQLN